MTLRRLLCAALSLLKIHEPDCDHCDVLQECWGIDMRKRLEELRPQQQNTKLEPPGLVSKSLPGADSILRIVSSTKFPNSSRCSSVMAVRKYWFERRVTEVEEQLPAQNKDDEPTHNVASRDSQKEPEQPSAKPAEKLPAESRAGEPSINANLSDRERRAQFVEETEKLCPPEKRGWLALK